MPKVLHLLKGDSAALAVPVIETSQRVPGTAVTVVLLHGVPAPALPPGVEVRKLSEGDLDYASLLELIFESDHVITW